MCLGRQRDHRKQNGYWEDIIGFFEFEIHKFLKFTERYIYHLFDYYLKNEKSTSNKDTAYYIISADRSPINGSHDESHSGKLVLF